MPGQALRGTAGTTQTTHCRFPTMTGHIYCHCWNRNGGQLFSFLISFRHLTEILVYVLFKDHQSTVTITVEIIPCAFFQVILSSTLIIIHSLKWGFRTNNTKWWTLMSLEQNHPQLKFVYTNKIYRTAHTKYTMRRTVWLWELEYQKGIKPNSTMYRFVPLGTNNKNFYL